jgi:5-methylcytosine-specific restriction endonuclease McrA
MRKRQDYTPSSQIRSALRKLFLRSRERSFRLKTDTYTCQRCGRKQSKAKGREIAVEVHHISGETRMKEIEDVIRLHLLCDPDLLETVCVDCHNKEHER